MATVAHWLGFTQPVWQGHCPRVAPEWEAIASTFTPAQNWVLTTQYQSQR